MPVGKKELRNLRRIINDLCDGDNDACDNGRLRGLITVRQVLDWDKISPDAERETQGGGHEAHLA